MIKIKCEQGSESWYEQRCGRITGTRFADVMMRETTKGFQDLIYNVAAEIISGEVEETYSSAIMERGKELEPAAREAFEIETGLEVEQIGFCIPDELDPLHEWIGYSPDGFIGNYLYDDHVETEFQARPYFEEGGLIEIKCPLAKTHLSYLEEDELPNEYQYQVQGGLWITGMPYCDFISYYPNMKLFIKRVEPDKAIIEALQIRVDDVIKLIKKKLEIYKKY